MKIAAHSDRRARARLSVAVLLYDGWAQWPLLAEYAGAYIWLRRQVMQWALYSRTTGRLRLSDLEWFRRWSVNFCGPRRSLLTPCVVAIPGLHRQVFVFCLQSNLMEAAFRISGVWRISQVVLIAQLFRNGLVNFIDRMFF